MLVTAENLVDVTQQLPQDMLVHAHIVSPREVLANLDYQQWVQMTFDSILPKAHFPWTLLNKIMRRCDNSYQDPSISPYSYAGALKAIHDDYSCSLPLVAIIEWETHDVFERFVNDLGIYTWLGLESPEELDLDKVVTVTESIKDQASVMQASLENVVETPFISAARLRTELIHLYTFA